MIKYYNVDAFKKLKEERKTAVRGFKYGFVTNVFKEDVYEELIKTFPDVTKFELVDKESGGGHKRFYVGKNYYNGKNWGSIRHMSDLPEIWKEVLKESGSKELIKLVEDSTGVKCNSLCNFGFTYGDEGCIQGPHIDGAARPNDPSPVHATIACLMYFNKEKGGVAGTEVYDVDRKTVLFAVPDLRNSFFYFEQHPDSWHGFPRVPKGADRRLVSLSFSSDPKYIGLSNSVFHTTYIKDCIKKISRKIFRK